jgi:phosphonate transport system substrate-binding protein
MEAAQALADARKSGDQAAVAKAQAEFDRIRAAAAQKRAMEPDV